MKKTKHIGLFFLLILMSFVVSPLIQQMTGNDIAIVNINELNEEENEKNKKQTIDLRFLLAEHKNLQDKYQATKYRTKQFNFYEAPTLLIHSPPPEQV